jgi:ribonuclease P protein subunit POP4
MIITPDIIREEFVGTIGVVTSSSHSGYLGIHGYVVGETRNTLTLQHDGTAKHVVKDQVVFQFQFSDGAVVEIDGRLLVGRSEDRLKKTVKRLW